MHQRRERIEGEVPDGREKLRIVRQQSHQEFDVSTRCGRSNEFTGVGIGCTPIAPIVPGCFRDLRRSLEEAGKPVPAPFRHLVAVDVEEPLDLLHPVPGPGLDLDGRAGRCISLPPQEGDRPVRSQVDGRRRHRHIRDVPLTVHLYLPEKHGSPPAPPADKVEDRQAQVSRLQEIEQILRAPYPPRDVQTVVRCQNPPEQLIPRRPRAVRRLEPITRKRGHPSSLPSLTICNQSEFVGPECRTQIHDQLDRSVRRWSQAHTAHERTVHDRTLFDRLIRSRIVHRSTAIQQPHRDVVPHRMNLHLREIRLRLDVVPDRASLLDRKRLIHLLGHRPNSTTLRLPEILHQPLRTRRQPPILPLRHLRSPIRPVRSLNTDVLDHIPLALHLLERCRHRDLVYQILLHTPGRIHLPPVERRDPQPHRRPVRYQHLEPTKRLYTPKHDTGHRRCTTQIQFDPPVEQGIRGSRRPVRLRIPIQHIRSIPHVRTRILHPTQRDPVIPIQPQPGLPRLIERELVQLVVRHPVHIFVRILHRIDLTLRSKRHHRAVRSDDRSPFRQAPCTPILSPLHHVPVLDHTIALRVQKRGKKKQ